MESNSEVLNLAIKNEESMKRSLSDEKLELRLGPPTSQVVQDQANPHKRVASSSVIGWPPVRSFRKKMAPSNSNLKPPLDPSSKLGNKGDVKMVNNNSLESKDEQFVKINMDGVPIGRKVNLRKYDNYESLSSAVDQLFRGLLEAQEGGWAATEQEERKEIAGLLDGRKEYTLVYEDNEGDKVLVGDVPWNMFLSTVKRLRVLKSSQLGPKHG